MTGEAPDRTSEEVAAAAAIADQSVVSMTARQGSVATAAVTRTSLTSVHALRGFAMLAVVMHHTLRGMMYRLSNRTLDGSTLKQFPVLAEFACGVDIFFVISGFLLVMISKPYLDRRRTIGNFMLHRIVRIWPLYVLVTCVMLARDFAKASAQGLPLPFDFQPLRLAGLLFIPSFDAGHMMRPIYAPGWTLSYEVWFYACVGTAIAFAASRREMLFGVAALVLGGIVIGNNLPDGSIAATFFSDPVAIEFLIGAAVYVLLQSGFRFPVAPVWWLGAGFLWLIAFAGYNADEGWRLGTRGLPATLFLVAMLKLEGKVTFPAWLIAISNASYSIFLTHGVVLPRLTEVSLGLFEGRVPHAVLGELASLTTFVMAVLIGLACFKFVEKPLNAKCRAWVGE